MALHVTALSQIAIYRDTCIEHKTFAVPTIVIGWHFFEVSQYASLQVENILKAELKHQCRRFLAANPAGAKHRQRPVSRRLGEFLREIRKLAKAVRAGINCARKRAYFDFVVIAGIDDEHVRIVN